MKPLDIVLTPSGGVGLVTVVSESGTASVEWINGFAGGKSAWWKSDELKVIDSLPDLLAREMAGSMRSYAYRPHKVGQGGWKDEAA